MRKVELKKDKAISKPNCENQKIKMNLKIFVAIAAKNHRSNGV